MDVKKSWMINSCLLKSDTIRVSRHHSQVILVRHAPLCFLWFWPLPHSGATMLEHTGSANTQQHAMATAHENTRDPIITLYICKRLKSDTSHVNKCTLKTPSLFIRKQVPSATKHHTLCAVRNANYHKTPCWKNHITSNSYKTPHVAFCGRWNFHYQNVV